MTLPFPKPKEGRFSSKAKPSAEPAVVGIAARLSHCFFWIFGIIILCSSYSYAQPLPVADLNLDSKAVIADAVALFDQGDIKGAQAELSRIRPNDSLYYNALYELCLVHMAREDYKSVRETAQLGLAQPNALHAGFLRNLASALDLLGQPDEAQKIFDQAIKRYPLDYQLYYNRGVALASQSKAKNKDKPDYSAAKANLKQALKLYPYHQPSHLALGVIYAEEGQVIPALMALSLAITFGPQTPRAELARQWLEHLLEVKYFELTAKTPQPENAGFVVLESDFLERIVYHSSYTGSKLEVPLPLLLQVELIVNRIEPAPNDTSFAMRFYAPVFAWVRLRNAGSIFCYQLLQDAHEKVIDDILAKRQSDLLAFRSALTNYLEKNFLQYPIVPEGGSKAVPTQLLYAPDGHLISAGNSTAPDKGDVATGYWQTFHPGGERSSTGSYDVMGRRTGLWRYFAPEGYQSAEENYSLGKLQGSVRSFYANGQPAEVFTADNGQPKGLTLSYYPSGVLRSQYNLANGKKQGKGVEFHPNGQTATSTVYINDTANGPLRVYSQTGRLLIAGTMLKGKLNGPYKAFHPNGKIAEDGTYENGKRKGEYRLYYPDGTLQRESKYVLDLLDGADRHFAPNGSLTQVSMYSKGKRHGLQQEYDASGYVRAELTFTNDLITAYRILAPDGKVLHTASDAVGTMLYVVPTGLGPDKYLQKGAYQFGAQTGPWQNYYPNGQVFEEMNYQDDQLNGQYVQYAQSNAILQRVNYKKGQASGLQETFYLGGEIASQGFMVNDVPMGYWQRFYPQGQVAERAYYRNGQPYGWQHEYTATGDLRRAVWLNAFGLPERIVHKKLAAVAVTQTDTLLIGAGAVSYTWPFATGKPYLQGCYLDGIPTDTWTTFYPDGRIEGYRTYVGGQLQGRTQQFYPNGQASAQGDYAADARTGLWQEFYPNGQLSAIGPYVNNLKQGQWLYFAPDGQRLRAEQYHTDKLDGEVQIFDGQDGVLPILRLFYVQDELQAYGYNAPTGDLVRLPLLGGTGEIKAKYANGNTAFAGYALAGQLSGYNNVYYPDGKVHTEAKYHCGVLTDDFRRFYPDGSPQTEAVYDHGVPTNDFRHYYPDGKPMLAYTYYNGELQGAASLWPTPDSAPVKIQYNHNAPVALGGK